LVLDAAALIADSGESTAAVAAEHSASAELARLRALREGGAGASLKMIDAAQADQARAQAQAQAAEARFASRWGPMATLPAAARQKLIEASARGGSVLLRAELPGRHTVGVLPARAVVDVDGIEVPGRVLGLLRESSEQQGVGLLIEVPNAPAGLGPGARIPVALLTADRQGLLLPRDALLYDDRGAYVYKQLTKKSDADKALYAAVRVNLLLPLGDGWLVEGVDDDDNIVVHGAGVLWSLQGVGAQQHDDDDDD
jgi:multidrug efflux pump subunit AcrA (membrane-fusion protein)